MKAYEWTDSRGNRWIASGDAKGRDSEVARNLEILRLAEENASLKDILVRRGDIRKAYPVFGQKIAELEAENRELTAKLAMHGRALEETDLPDDYRR